MPFPIRFSSELCLKVHHGGGSNRASQQRCLVFALAKQQLRIRRAVQNLDRAFGTVLSLAQPHVVAGRLQFKLGDLQHPPGTDGDFGVLRKPAVNFGLGIEVDLWQATEQAVSSQDRVHSCLLCLGQEIHRQAVSRILPGLPRGRPFDRDVDLHFRVVGLLALLRRWASRHGRPGIWLPLPRLGLRTHDKDRCQREQCSSDSESKKWHPDTLSVSLANLGGCGAVCGAVCDR